MSGKSLVPLEKRIEEIENKIISFEELDGKIEEIYEIFKEIKRIFENEIGGISFYPEFAKIIEPLNSSQPK